MNKRRHLVSLALVAALAAPVRAADPSTGGAAGWSPSTDAYGNVFTEAARAIVGRVFGVAGDAGDIDYHVVELTTHAPANAAARSALVPGWGQRFNGEKIKGTVFFLSFVGATAGAVMLHQRADDKWDDYRSKGVKDDPLYDDYDRARTQSTMLAVAAVVLWSVSVVDAYRHAYTPLYGGAPAVDLAFASDEAQLRVRRRF